MSTLAKLKLVSIQADRKNATTVRRAKLTGKIQSQISLAKAQLAGDVFTAKRVKVLTDQVSGERKAVEVFTHVKPWWFNTQAGKLVLSLRYGAKLLEISKGKNAIEVADMDDLIATLEVVKQAAHAGELDAQIEQASSSLRAGFGKKKGAAA
jgi:hypothetical protein